MCMWFWSYPSVILYQLLTLFRLSFFFQVQLVQHRCLVAATPPKLFHWSFRNYAYLLYMVWRWSCWGFGVILPLPFFSTFCFFFFFFFFNFIFFSCDTMTWELMVATSYSFIPNFLKLCRCFCHGLKMCMCFWGYTPIIFYQLFPPLFQRFFRSRLSE